MRLRTYAFTLLEVLISILIITIAFFAVLTTELTAIQGYTSARDYTRASEIAKVAIESLQIEANTWRNSGQIGTNNPWGATAGDTHPFDNSLSQIAGNGWGSWTVMTSAPVDERLGRGADFLGARFCIYGRGGYLEMDTTDLNVTDGSGNFESSPVFQVQIAVVYSGPTAEPIVNCAANTDVDRGNLVPDDPAKLEALEIAGRRAAFFGTVILRRDW